MGRSLFERQNSGHNILSSGMNGTYLWMLFTIFTMPLAILGRIRFFCFFFTMDGIYLFVDAVHHAIDHASQYCDYGLVRGGAHLLAIRC